MADTEHPAVRGHLPGLPWLVGEPGGQVQLLLGGGETQGTGNQRQNCGFWQVHPLSEPCVSTIHQPGPQVLYLTQLWVSGLPSGRSTFGECYWLAQHVPTPPAHHLSPQGTEEDLGQERE